jgi:uncharacterized protein (TIGR02646 family)
MHHVRRLPLNKKTADYLAKRQVKANLKQQAGTLTPENEWKSARQTRSIGNVLSTLQRMMGDRERCMYCLDSHGADIEHFWPKTPYPERMFFWPNLLLCCTECGRFKRNQFPLDNGQPLLVDPTDDDPWDHIDFDPTTGNLVAKFDLQANDWSAKGLKTVEVLHLDRREALAAGYTRTFRRISSIISDCLQHTAAPVTTDLMNILKEADDHGLLGWCFYGAGQNAAPFSDFRTRFPDLWTACVAAIRAA